MKYFTGYDEIPGYKCPDTPSEWVKMILDKEKEIVDKGGVDIYISMYGSDGSCSLDFSYKRPETQADRDAELKRQAAQDQRDKQEFERLAKKYGVVK